ncbi:MAG: Jag N-terminal domain-containing protein [Candidatus Dadabacteria bacterium]|jgi:spoIIIJ-associated protein|nr:Jag N-terminal domain-containing protein [Candidatus Dadabacteria bacterium]
MGIVLEKEGKTVSDATMSACEELGISRSEIDVEVLQKSSKGVLGIGSRNAKVRITVKDENLSEKGLKSKKALEAILGHLIPTYSIGIRENPDRIKLDIRDTNDKGLLIGKRGEMIKALEYIVGKISGRSCEDGREKRVSIDVDGYKMRREDKISRLVKDTAREVRKVQKPISLEPMSASERRMAYIALKREGGVGYETKVERDEKRIIIIPHQSRG